MSLDASCQPAYEAVFSDGDPTKVLVLGYDGRKIVVKHQGEGGLAEESLASERALRHEPPRVRKAAAREMAKFFKPKPQIAERRSQETVVFDAVLRDARRQRRKAGYSSARR